MKASIFLLVILLAASVLLGAPLFVITDDGIKTYNYEVKKERVFVPIEVAEFFADKMVLTSRGDAGYIVNRNRDILFVDGRKETVTKNFLVEYPSGCYMYEEGASPTLMVDKGILERFLHIESLSVGETVILYTRHPALVSVEKVDDGWVMNFDMPVMRELFEMEVGEGWVELHVYGVVPSTELRKESYLTPMANGVMLKFEGKIMTPRLEVDGKVAKLVLGPPPGYEEYEKVSEGLMWYRRRIEIRGKKVILTYMEVDPNYYDVELELANGKVVGGERVTQMVKRTGAIAGVNGGYFDPKTMTPIGFIVKNSKLLHLPYSIRPVFLRTTDGKFDIRRIRFELNVRLGDVLFYVKGVNTPAKGDVLLYSEEYGPKIPFSDKKRYFISNGIWIIDEGYVEHPATGTYVLAVDKKFNDLLKDVKPGDTFRLIQISDMDAELDFAVEGGPFLLKDGNPVIDYREEKSLYSSYITESYAPRTVVGITKDGKLVFMTVKGEKVRGLNYDGLVELVMQLNLKDAMCLDGGRSSALVLKGRLLNKKPEEEAFVPTAILIYERRGAE